MFDVSLLFNTSEPTYFFPHKVSSILHITVEFSRNRTLEQPKKQISDNNVLNFENSVSRN